MSIFDNEMNEETGHPVCFVCKKDCLPDQGATSGLYGAPAGQYFIAHHDCATSVNTLAKMGLL